MKCSSTWNCWNDAWPRFGCWLRILMKAGRRMSRWICGPCTNILPGRNLCTEVRVLDAELQSMKGRLRGLVAAGEMPATLAELEAQLDPLSARQLHLLLGGLKAIQADVRRLSRVHSELLRRSRRSVNVLLNFLAHYSGSYPPSLIRSRGCPTLRWGNDLCRVSSVRCR